MYRRLLRWVRVRRKPLFLSVLCLTVVELLRLETPQQDSKHNQNKVSQQSQLAAELNSNKEQHEAKHSYQYQPIAVDTSGPIFNPHPFEYIINNPRLCPPNQNIFLLNYVHTAVDHFHRRQRIRNTWANESTFSPVHMKTIFVVGISDKLAWLQDALEYEAKQYGDIVQEDFLDTYR
jgi:hypothetical protein